MLADVVLQHLGLLLTYQADTDLNRDCITTDSMAFDLLKTPA